MASAPNWRAVGYPSPDLAVFSAEELGTASSTDEIKQHKHTPTKSSNPVRRVLGKRS